MRACGSDWVLHARIRPAHPGVRDNCRRGSSNCDGFSFNAITSTEAVPGKDGRLAQASSTLRRSLAISDIEFHRREPDSPACDWLPGTKGALAINPCAAPRTRCFARSHPLAHRASSRVLANRSCQLVDNRDEMRSPDCGCSGLGAPLCSKGRMSRGSDSGTGVADGSARVRMKQIPEGSARCLALHRMTRMHRCGTKGNARDPDQSAGDGSSEIPPRS
jgi:hypothetical protein